MPVEPLDAQGVTTVSEDGVKDRDTAPRWNMKIDLSLLLPLLAVLAAQAVSSLTLHNTAFEDEALYLNAGHQIISQWLGGPRVTDPFVTYFSGLPYIYAVIGGSFDKLGGLEAARFFSLICMLAGTALLYVFVGQLFGSKGRLPAAMIFACQGTVLFLGRMATYDALCLVMLALASVLAARKPKLPSVPASACVGILLALAIATKYGAALFAPSILLLLFLQTRQAHGLRSAMLCVVIGMFALAFVIGEGLLLLPTQQIMAGLSYTTTNRIATTPASTMTLIWRVISLGGVILGLALTGLFLIERANKRLAALLFVTALLAPAYHLTKGEFASLHKHIAFSAYFAAPLAGTAIARMLAIPFWKPIARSRAVCIASCLVLLSLGVYQGQILFHEWPNTDATLRLLQAAIQPGDRILSEDSRVPQYYLQSSVPPGQFSSCYWFEYRLPDGTDLEGRQAYLTAVSDGYFNLIELYLGNDAGAPIAREIQGRLATNPRYTLIGKLPYHSTLYGTGNFWIWRKRGTAASASD